MSEALRIWWHPRRTARELAELRDGMSVLQEELLRSEEVRTSLQTSLAVAEQSLRSALEEMAEMRAGIEALTRQVKDYEDEAAEWSRIEEEMLDVYRKLESVEELKRDYERKIERLRLRLRDEMTEDASDDSSELIDMQTDAPQVVSSGTRQSAAISSNEMSGDDTSHEESTSPWLRILPRDL
ncbi:MAG: hypothetical protein K2M03_04350 [Muribaculaceae bacterium]|nr:hypothetical protein [Muribaculaceae bacterium]